MFLLSLASVTAHSDCVAKLADVDKRLSDSSIEPNQQAAIQQIRDQAADLCSKGADPTSMQLLGMLEMMIPTATVGSAPAAAGTEPGGSRKLQLEDDFLAGTWCSMTGEERVSLVFSEKGTYKPCFPAAGQGYVQCGPERPTDKWLDSFVANESSGPNEMVMVTKRSGRKTFLRGECSDHGR